MKDEELVRAFRALREETSGAAPDAEETLDRVLVSVHVRQRRRFWLVKPWLPIAAVLVGTSAWAAASGRLDSIWPAADDPPPPAAVVAATAQPSERAPFTSAPFTSAQASATVAPSAEAAPSATAAPAPPRVHASASSTAVAPSSAAPARNTLAQDKADFEAAYRLHAATKAGDVAKAQAAVAAWNQYLATHPNGRFVPEAKYARAVALARAGLRNEAREALRPFADGEPGSYRRDDALEVMQAIEKD
jgi:hypothetical protein